MRIGIISDTHDNLPNLKTALTVLRDERATRLLHCGDICKPGTVQAMAGFDVWIARGNMDRDPQLPRVAEEVLGKGHLARCHRLTLNGYAIGVLHGDDGTQLRDLIASGSYAYIFHGHTHRRRDQRIGPTRVINPGALGGVRWQQRSLCILDLTTDEVHFVHL